MGNFFQALRASLIRANLDNHNPRRAAPELACSGSPSRTRHSPAKRFIWSVYLIILAAVFLGAIFSGFPGSGASGQEAAESIKGRLEIEDETAEGPRRVFTPVSGVRITVSQDGAEIGSATSDGSGEWSVSLPSRGTYQVRLHTDTLPQGVALTNPERVELPNVIVDEGQSKTVRFNFGSGARDTVSRLERISNLVFSGLRFGAIIAMCSVGLSLIYGVTGLVNFAHGELVTLGAVVAYFLHTSSAGPQMSLLLAIVPTLIICGLFGAGMEAGIWKPLRKRQTSLIALSLVSIGLGFVIRYLIAIVFGVEFRSYSDYSVQDPVDFGWLSVAPKSMLILVVSVMLLAVFGLFLMLTRTGVGIRAVAANRDLASVSGINVERVIMGVWVMGTASTALGGIFLGISERLDWRMGLRLLLLMFAAIVLGGLGTAFGAMLGGFLIGLIVEVSTYWIDNEFKLVIGLGVLVLMLFVRPKGLLGYRERTA